MFVEITRLLIVLACLMSGLVVGRFFDAANLGGILGTLIGYVGGGVVGRGLDRGFGIVERTVEAVPPGTLFSGGLGAVVGGLGGIFVAGPVMLLFPYSPVFLIASVVVWVSGVLGARVAMQRAEAFLAMAGLSTRPLVRSIPYAADEGHIVDTSAVMDGQLTELITAGFLEGDLFVARFVLDELQGLADLREGTRARRARRGLERLEALRQGGRVRVRVLDDEVPEQQEVDAKLVTLARRLQIRLLTCDVNLQRVAELQGVAVVNLRRLADDLRPEMVPGDVVSVEIVREGRESGQGVGYLEDGSMVVVNDGVDLVGAGNVDVEVVTIVPTAVGRLVFARPPSPRRSEPPRVSADAD